MSIPREFQFNTDECEADLGNALQQAFDALASMPEDFFSDERDDAPAQPREGL